MVDGYFIHQESPICSLPTTLSRHTQNTFPLPASRVFTTPPPTSKSSSRYLFLDLSFSYYSLLQEVFCVQCHNHQGDLHYVRYARVCPGVLSSSWHSRLPLPLPLNVRTFPQTTHRLTDSCTSITTTSSVHAHSHSSRSAILLFLTNISNSPTEHAIQFITPAVQATTLKNTRVL